MKKIGLCICYNVHNYGSVLQALATVKIIEQLGYEYEIIGYIKKRSIFYYIKKAPLLLSKTFYYVLKRKISIIKQARKSNEYKANLRLRKKIFNEFSKEHFVENVKKYIGYSELKRGSSNYYAIIVGSDQLWNPMGFSTNFYNLMFVKDEVKKISYATSFGISHIPIFYRTKARKFISRIDHLSVREIEAKNIIAQLVPRKKVFVAADPTLLFNREQWEVLIPQKNEVIDEYIFCYFLGTSLESRNAANELSDYLGLKIVTIKHEDEYFAPDDSFGDYSPNGLSPNDFVNYIRNAKYILTDSYHGTIFSIINHKKFLTFYRFKQNDKNSRNSRIDSLLNILGLQNRLFTQESNVRTIMEEINYDEIDKRVNVFRNESIDFLKDALENCEKDHD
ncbi:MAG: polysaccharide pyruvyl transferase family protein [Candidatus Izemoplasmatales bacterium]|jgi:hypothetical protein